MGIRGSRPIRVKSNVVSVPTPILCTSSFEASLLGISLSEPTEVKSNIVNVLTSILTTSTFEASVLGSLPPELIIYLAERLPAASAACLALSCRSIYAILGTRYWEALKAGDPHRNREAFLLLLERDMPNHIRCYHCSTLHSANKIPDVNTTTESAWRNYYKMSRCYQVEYHACMSAFIHINFHLCTFQMAMKRHRLGLDYSRHLSLLERNRMHPTGRKGFPYQFNTQVRIVAGSLLIRVREVHLVPSNGDLAKFECIEICPHRLSLASPDSKRKGTHDLSQHNKLCELKQCSHCPTEYQIGREEVEPYGIAVVITRWLDVGEGRTFLDPKWWSHLGGTYTNQEIFAGTSIHTTQWTKRPAVPFEAGSIRASFEQDDNSAPDMLVPSKTLEELLMFCSVLILVMIRASTKEKILTRIGRRILF